MASRVTNKAAYELLNWLATTSTLRCMLLTASTTVPDDPDHDFVSDIVADEASGTNYSRQTVGGVSASEDDANDRAELTSNDITFASLGSDVGAIVWVVFYVEVTDDTDSWIVSVHDLSGIASGDRTPNDNDFIIRMGSEGFIHALTV